MTIAAATEHTWLTLRELTRRLLTEEPQEVRALRTGALPDQPGSYGQYFTTWDLANGILRDYAMNLYQSLRMAANEALSVESTMIVLRAWDPIYSEYLGYSGFVTLAEHAQIILEPGFRDRDALIEALSAFTGYANRLTAWSHHYFPWHLGERYRYAADPPAPPVMSPPSAPPRGGRGRSPFCVPIRLRWQPLGIEVMANLAGDLNPRLCSDFLSALPFTVLQDHAVVTGESIYAWTPLVTLAPAAVTERICDSPIGRLRFSQATGNKLVIQYGRTTETLRVPVLGQALDRDIAALREVGRAVWESTFRTKEHIWLSVERA